MNEIDVPVFKRGKHMIGNGFMDWVKKHKKELGLTAGALASLAALAGAVALSHKTSEAHRGYRPGFPERPFNPLKVAESEKDVEQFNRDISTEIRALRHQARRESALKPFSPPPPQTPPLPPRRISIPSPPRDEEKRERRSSLLYPDGIPLPQTPPLLSRRRHSYDVPPPLIPATPILTSRRISSGRGKPNPLAKKVMAYKKKHGCSLKEAWAQFK